jgi:hypothetical protein
MHILYFVLIKNTELIWLFANCVSIYTKMLLWIKKMHLIIQEKETKEQLSFHCNSVCARVNSATWVVLISECHVKSAWWCLFKISIQVVYLHTVSVIFQNFIILTGIICNWHVTDITYNYFHLTRELPKPLFGLHVFQILLQYHFLLTLPFYMD